PTRNQKNASCDHGRSVNQRTNRRRSFHRIRQPDVKRELPGLAGGTAENQQCDEGGAGADGQKSRVFEATASLVVKQKGAAVVVEPKHPEKEPEIADARGDESFLRRSGGARPLDPEANQQIGRESNQFPANEK